MGKNRNIFSSLDTNTKIGLLDWIEYRELKEGSLAFKEIHDGSCSSPKIILLVNR